MDLISVFGIFFTVFNCCVFVPGIVYGLYVFYKVKENDLMTYRNPIIVYLMNILVVIALLTERIFMVSIQVWNIIDVPIWIVYLYFSVMWWAINYLFVVKVYHLYFQQQYNLSIADISWRQDINPNENDWYIKNRNTYGNPIYLIKIVLIPYLMSVSLDGLFPVLIGEGLAFDFFHFIIASIPVCLSFIALWKARLLNDIYKIRNELLYQSLIIGTALSIYCIVFLVCHFNEYLINKYPKNIIRFEWLSYILVTDAIAFACSMFSTVYSTYLVKRGKLETLLFEEQSRNTSSTNAMNDLNGFKANLQHMNKIISNYNSFKLFISYLVSEFCAENLLYLVELIQCKHDYQKRNNFVVKTVKELTQNNSNLTVETDEKTSQKEKLILIDFNKNVFNLNENFKTEAELYFTYLFHSDGSIMTKLSLPVNIPKTIILTQYENNLYDQMFALYNKYIKNNSVHELNVSYAIRSQLSNLFKTNQNSHKEYEIFNIMDECAIEISLLMLHSFARFINTELYLNHTEAEKIVNNNTVLKDASLKELLNSAKAGVVTEVAS